MLTAPAMSKNGDLKHSPSSWRGAGWYLSCKMKKRPILVNLELTKKCNAKCDFCACWKSGQTDELSDYAPVIDKLRPLIVSVSGGEPLIRKGWQDLLRRIRPFCHYMILITNGAVLSEKIADQLSEVGLNQLAISLDYLDETHDNIRNIPGLFKKISTIVPNLTAKGYKVMLNSVIMEGNLDHILPLAHTSKSWGAGISFSSYCSLKREEDALMIREDKLRQLEDVISELIGLKRTLGHIRNSDYYLRGIPKYFREGGMAGCKAGRRWVQLAPDGMIQPCTELPTMCRYDEYDQKKVPETSCVKCWYTCRGEAEAPWFVPERLMQLIRS